MTKILWVCIVLATAGGSALGEIIRVPGDQPTIQAGLNATVSDDTVLVAPGTYVEQIWWAGTSVAQGVSLISEAGAPATIIDGGGGTPLQMDSREGRNAVFGVIDGFTFTNGGRGAMSLDYAQGTFRNCDVTGNSSPYTDGGAALRVGTAPKLRFESCRFFDNTNSTRYGWAAALTANAGGGSEITFDSCEITDHEVTGFRTGGDYLRATFINCLFARNGNSKSYGGGVSLSSYGAFVLNSCTFADNQAVAGGGFGGHSGVTPNVKNCIFWGNSSPQIERGGTSISYCDIQGGYAWGSGNIDADPLFFDPEGGDYHLTAGSPCIDAGAAGGAPETDLEGDLRDAWPDMGMDEWIPVNARPEVTILSPRNGASFLSGTVIPFEGEAWDPEEGLLPDSAHVWSSSIDGILGWGRNFDFGDLTRGQHEIRLEAEDTDGAWDADSISISILNRGPEVTILAPADGAMFAIGDPVTLAGDAWDPEEGALADTVHVWSSSLDGELGRGRTLELDDLSQGSHTLELVARDDEGVLGSDAITLVIQVHRTSRVPQDYPAIGEAIEASGAGDTVQVAPGTYGGEGNLDLAIDAAREGMVLRSEGGASVTVIDGGGASRGFRLAGALSSATRIEGFTVRNGHDAIRGGAVACDDEASPEFRDCALEGSTAPYGGAVSCRGGAAPRFVGCRFTGNAAGFYGGALDAYGGGGLWLSNCLFSENSAGHGGGLSLRGSGATATLTHCTLVANQADFAEGGGAVYVRSSSASLVSCIVWSNRPNALVGKVSATYSDVEGGAGQPWFGVGCIELDPLFRDPAAGDYHVQATACGHDADSPVIDAGDPVYEDAWLHCEGGLGGPRSDMGERGGPRAFGAPCGPLDFETDPLGEPPVVGQPVTDGFAGEYGVVFRVEGGADSMRVGDYGGEFQGWGCDDGRADSVTVGVKVGKHFLAHPDAIGSTLRDVWIDYPDPTPTLGFDLADIDHREEWEVSAFDQEGALVEERVIGAGDPGTGDGVMSRIRFQGGAAVASLRIRYIGVYNHNIGFGFDNFYTRCSTNPCEVEAGIEDAPGEVAPGETLEFRATATNLCPESRVFDQARLDISGPGVKLVQLLYDGSPLEVASQAKVGARVVLPVPEGVSPGTYRVTLTLLGTGYVLSSESFEVMVP